MNDDSAWVPAPPWQEPAHAALLGLFARGIHAGLLHGQAGTGKLATALAVARDLLCEAPVDARACGHCAGCRLVQSGSHPDLRIVVPEALQDLLPATGGGDDEGAGAPAEESGGAEVGEGKRRSREIKIEQVRALGVLAGVSAHRSGRRVVVLGPAETLNVAAGNAALKLLEEPPPQMVFVLVADALDEVLPTIRSRATLVRGGWPEPAAAQAWLAAQGVADPARRLAEAGGAPLAALRQAGRPMLDDDARGALVGMLSAGRSLSAARVAAEVPRTIAIGPACQLMQRWGWDVIATRHGAPVRYHPGERVVIERLAAQANPAAWLAWVSELERLRRDAEHPLNARLAVEAALLGYVRAVEAHSGAD